jgi:predicted DNA-binding transcriptional regulator AlpA
MPDRKVNNLINRKEIAERLNITVNSVRKMCDNGRFPVKVQFIGHVAWYERTPILIWIATDPVRKYGCGFDKETGKRHRHRRYLPATEIKYEPGLFNCSDAYRIALFCKPGLRNRGLSYEDW